MSKIVINCETNSAEEIEYTAEEIAERNQRQAELEAQRLAQEAEQAAKEAARLAALEKLAALGLSPEEVAAIKGA